MGIPGLTSFINRNSTSYFENHQLTDSLIIIDGYALTNYLYKMYEKQTSAFGGDYDIISTVYIDFINLLLRCNITPIFVFDGAYEQRKIETIVSRISQRIHSYGQPIKTNECMPCFGSDILFDILNDMDIPIINCDFEADAEIVAIAKLLNCPVISRDSDFYVNVVPYIPLDMINFDLTSNENIINCRIYKVEKLLNAFGGLDTNYLPLVAALLGNDYIRPDTFASMLRIQPGSFNCGLKLRRIIDWLRKQNNVNSAMNNMIYNLSKSKDYIKKQIQTIIHDYNSMESKYISFIFQYKRMSKYQDRFKHYTKLNEKKILPPWLEQYYRKGIVNSEVMTMITMRKIFFKVQIEDYDKPPYYEISFNILGRIFGLLFGKTDLIPGFGRKNGYNLGQYKLKPYIYNPYVPLTDLNEMDINYRKNIILNLIGVKNFKGIPKEWELFTIALIYWATYTNNRKSKHMNALIICAMIFNIIKNTDIDSPDKLSEKPTDKCIIEDNITKVKKDESIKAMDILSNYFQVNEYNDKKLYYKIIHPFTQFQCCVYFFMILNSLLNFPYSQCRIEKFYKGTLLYNLCLKMENFDPELFVSQQLFGKLDSLNAVYKSIIDYLNKIIPVPKKRTIVNKSVNLKPKIKK